ncbi:hypothetical protein GGI12_000897 [Dipsacomyces acuminosporus]|nr:hypothetical protein GGI12_000897 [Dipsacomyces acuminosporus]
MVSASSVTLVLDSPEVVLYGRPNEASGSFITGKVIVSARHASQVRSLAVMLRPYKRRFFQSMQSVTPHIDISAILVEDGKTLSQIPAAVNPDKTQEWRFSMPVPGSIAETVYTNDNYVAYELVAEAKTASTFSSQLLSRPHPIAIKRAPSVDSRWAMTLSEPVSETANWRSRLELTLCTESRIINDKQAICVRGVIRPLEKGISLLRAGFQIVEKIVNNVDLFGMPHVLTSSNVIVGTSIDIPHCRTASRQGSDGPDDDFSNLFASGTASSAMGLPVIHEISTSRCLSVPEAYKDIQYDISQGPIRVSHDIIFFVTIADETGSVHNLRLATPIFVLPCFSHARVDLPRYEDAGMDELIESSTKAPASSTDAQMPLPGSADECPLAIHGYRSSGDIPPPVYSCSTILAEDSLFSVASIAAPQQAFTADSRIRTICPQAMLAAIQPAPLRGTAIMS